MNIAELGPGIAMGVGKTNFRIAGFDELGIMDERTLPVPTPPTRQEFFALSSNTIIEAARNGAKWAVMGVPGPVTVVVDAEDKVRQNFRITNIASLNRKRGFNPIAEMAALKPAILDLIDDGEFNFLVVNDGDLAVQAAAALFAYDQDNVVADIIDGSGTGGAAALRDRRFKQRLFHPFPGIWEMGHLPDSLDHPTATPEQAVSGTALDGKLEGPIRELDSSHPVFPLIARGLAKIAIVFAMTAEPDLIVISGGIGIEAQDQYKKALEAELKWFEASNNPMADKVAKARIVYPDKSLTDTYELYGAPGAMRSHLTTRAINQLVLNTD